jgi:hypothetical protein
MSANFYNKNGTSRESQAAHFSGATGEKVTIPSGTVSNKQYIEDIAKSLKDPVPVRRDTNKDLLDFNKGGKRRKTRRNKRKSKKRKSRRRISRKR